MISHHLAELAQLSTVYHLDANKICNWYEKGATTDKETTGPARCKWYVNIDADHDIRIA